MPRPVATRIQVFLLGKSASYRLNAYDDAAIASEIVCFIQTGEMPAGNSPIHQRAAHLIASTPEACKLERLTVQAYTLFHVNGYADIMWSRCIEQVAGLMPPVTRPGYGEFEQGPIDLFSFWVPALLKRDVSRIRTYARKVAGLELTLGYSQIIGEIIRVQEANIAANHHTCHLLRAVEATGHPKVEAIRRLASEVLHSRLFMRGAAHTQIAAGNWDRLLVVCLKARYGRMLARDGSSPPLVSSHTA